MIRYFPNIFSKKGTLLYFVSLATVSIVYLSYAMPFVYMLLGALEVTLFFVLSNRFTKDWENVSDKQFINNVFFSALALRVAWVIFSYYFYINKTGVPFEYGAADAIAYHEDAKWLAIEKWPVVINYLLGGAKGFSDSGYLLYLQGLYRIIGPNIFVARLLKAVYSSFTCVLLYKFTLRSINRSVGRIAAVFAVLMPNLIIYCGLHLKETEMIFLIVAFLERADYLLHSEGLNVPSILLTIVIVILLFSFRTVLGMVAVFSFVTALLLSTAKKSERGNKTMLIAWCVLAVAYLVGNVVVAEIENTWENRNENQQVKRTQQTLRGNKWAQYATGSVMVPIMFVTPLSTMVDTGQENQFVFHGGNYVRNFMGAFVLIAIFYAIFKTKKWRDFLLIGSFTIGYLSVISLSGFAGTERFSLPGLPGLIVMWAYGFSVLDAQNYKLVKFWYYIVPIMEIAWAFFKIGSRGLLG